MLADDPRGLDAEAGNDQHEDGPDQVPEAWQVTSSDLVGKAVERGKMIKSESDRSPSSRPKSSMRAGHAWSRPNSSRSRS